MVTAVCEIFDIVPSDFGSAAEATWWPETPNDHQGGRAELAILMRALVRLTRPEIVVETGVAQGVTTAVILQGMHDNSSGFLYSIDLPALDIGSQYTGALVPGRLSERWELIEGPSRIELPRLLARLPGIDIFLHDADHTYSSQTEEYRTAWAHLRPGGLLVSDDVRTAAFVDFCTEHNVRPYLIPGQSALDGLGLVCKP
jgi:predicted O-methyltransferase YrrM